MEKKEKLEKQENDERLPGYRSVNQALAGIKSNSKASKALKRLIDQGFDEKSLVQIVYAYCGGTEEQVSGGLQLAKRFADELDDCWRELRKGAARVQRITKQLEGKGYTLHARGLRDGELPSLMRSFAAVLLIVARGYQSGVNNIRVGGKEKRHKKTKSIARSKLTIASGRTHYLVYLAYLISGGKAPTKGVFDQIAPLVAAVRRDRDPFLDDIVKSLSKAVRRFWNDHLFDAYLWAEQAEEDFENRPVKNS